MDIGVGEIVAFDYPTRNTIDERPVWRRRRVLVTSVRRLRASPLHPATVALAPLRRRGRTLVTGVDLDLGEERSFYVESMKGCRRRTWLGLALYDPLDRRSPLEWHPWVFAPTRRDLRFLADVCQRFAAVAERDPDVLLSVGVFPRPQERDT